MACTVVLSCKTSFMKHACEETTGTGTATAVARKHELEIQWPVVDRSRRAEVGTQRTGTRARQRPMESAHGSGGRRCLRPTEDT